MKIAKLLFVRISKQARWHQITECVTDTTWVHYGIVRSVYQTKAHGADIKKKQKQINLTRKKANKWHTD